MEDTLAAPTPPALAPVSPLRKRGRPRDEAADGRILTAASDLFLERGYDAMTIDAIALRAHVGKATVYRRWASKEILAAAAVRHLYGVDEPVPDTGSLREDLVWAFGGLLRFVNSTAGRKYLRTSVVESVRDPRVAHLHRLAVAGLEEKAGTILDRAVQRGQVARGASATWSVRWLLGLVIASAVIGEDPPGPGDAEDLVRMVVDGIGS